MFTDMEMVSPDGLLKCVYTAGDLQNSTVTVSLIYFCCQGCNVKLTVVNLGYKFQ